MIPSHWKLRRYCRQAVHLLVWRELNGERWISPPHHVVECWWKGRLVRDTELFQNCTQIVFCLKWTHTRPFGEFCNSPGTDFWCTHLLFFAHSDKYRPHFRDLLSLPGSYLYDRNMACSRIHRFLSNLKNVR